MSQRVVIVEDDFLILGYLADCCELFGYTVVGDAGSAEKAVSVILETRPDVVLMDLRLTGRLDGVDVAQQVRSELPELKIVFITGSSEPASIARIRSSNPNAVLIKPIEPEQLRQALL